MLIILTLYRQGWTVGEPKKISENNYHNMHIANNPFNWGKCSQSAYYVDADGHRSRMDGYKNIIKESPHRLSMMEKFRPRVWLTAGYIWWNSAKSKMILFIFKIHVNVNVNRTPSIIDLYNYTRYALNIVDKLAFI